MSRDARMTRRQGFLLGGFSTAAAAAAMIGMGTAHADDGSVPTDIGLLNTAESNVLEGFAATGRTDTVFPDLIGKLDAVQTPLLSSDNSFVSGFGEALFNGPDQQLEQSSEAFLSASQALAAEPTNLTALSDFASAGFQLDDSAFGEIPFNLIGKLTDQIFDIGGFDTASASAATDLASAVAAAPTTPADLLSEATTNYTDANQLLADLPSGPSGADYAQDVATEIQVQDKLLEGIGNVGSAESALSSYDSGVLSDLLNPWFTSVDQGWDQVSEAALNADQALESAAATGSATDVTTAVLGLLGPEYQAIGPAFQSDFVDLAAHFLTGGDFTSAADLAAGVDPVSALDPSIFADLLSSIGL